eukprot:scaffold92245_cov24-Tisochrysis_lutea.AAC.1
MTAAYCDVRKPKGARNIKSLFIAGPPSCSGVRRRAHPWGYAVPQSSTSSSAALDSGSAASGALRRSSSRSASSSHTNLPRCCGGSTGMFVPPADRWKMETSVSFASMTGR